LGCKHEINRGLQNKLVTYHATYYRYNGSIFPGGLRKFYEGWLSVSGMISP